MLAFATLTIESTVDDLIANDQPNAASSPSLFDQLMAISRASALEEMASGIAHELNQPLGAINTFAQAGDRLLNRPDASVESAREIFQLISKEALVAAAGIQRIRRLFHRDNLNRAPCVIEDLIQELTPALRLLAGNVGVELTVGVDQAPPRVSVDRLRIQHVIYTIAQNAIDASASSQQPGAKQVRISIDGDRYGALISITDSGGGIPEEHRFRVFHPFFTTKADGTGLGLASAKAIVHSHEGTISFDNVTGGTRFSIRLPADTETGHE